MDEHLPGPQPSVSVFEVDDALVEHERELYRQGVRRARNVLFFAGGIMFIVDLIMVIMQQHQLVPLQLYSIIGIDVFVLAVFIGLGLWTRHRAYTAILTGLLLFCGLQVLGMAMDPTNIYKGVLVKIVVIISLVSGLKKARALQQLENRRNIKFD